MCISLYVVWSFHNGASDEFEIPSRNDDVGIPNSLLSDGAPEVTAGPKTEFMKEVHRLKIKPRRSGVGRSNQTYAGEPEISERLKKRWRNRMVKHKVPPRCGITGLFTKPIF